MGHVGLSWKLCCSAPWLSSEEDPRWHDSPAARDESMNDVMFWHLLPGPVIGGQAYSVLR